MQGIHNDITFRLVILEIYHEKSISLVKSHLSELNVLYSIKKARCVHNCFSNYILSYVNNVDPDQLAFHEVSW